jgi:hypothetical protein
MIEKKGIECVGDEELLVKNENNLPLLIAKYCEAIIFY